MAHPLLSLRKTALSFDFVQVAQQSVSDSCASDQTPRRQVIPALPTLGATGDVFFHRAVYGHITLTTRCYMNVGRIAPSRTRPAGAIETSSGDLVGTSIDRFRASCWQSGHLAVAAAFCPNCR